MQSTRDSNIVLMLFTALSLSVSAMGQSAKGDIQQKLEKQYALTTINGADIATAGAILVLKKDDLQLIDSTSGRPFPNTYKDGKLTHSALEKLALCKSVPGKPAAKCMTFLGGKKMWVTRIDVGKDAVTFGVLTDPLADNLRYSASVAFPYPKGTTQSPDEVAKSVNEVFGVVPVDAPPAAPAAPVGSPAAAAAQPIDNSSAGGAPPPLPDLTIPQSPTSAAATAAVPQPASNSPQVGALPSLPDLAIPQSPNPAPPVLKVGMTVDELIKILGQPSITADLGDKRQKLVFNVKFTVVDGKVVSIQ